MKLRQAVEHYSASNSHWDSVLPRIARSSKRSAKPWAKSGSVRSSPRRFALIWMGAVP